MPDDDLDRRLHDATQTSRDTGDAPAFTDLLPRIATRRTRHRVVSSLAAVVLVVAAAVTWIARDDDATTRVHVPPATHVPSTTPSPATAPTTTIPVTTTGAPQPRCGAPTPPPSERVSLAGAAWRALPPPPSGRRSIPTLVWTGNEVVAFGDVNSQTALTEAYNPSTRSWRRLPDAPFTPSESMTGVWTGREVIVASDESGGAYDPSTNTWRVLSRSPIPEPAIRGLAHSAATWTGSELVLLRTPGGPGAAYDPCTDTWRTIAPMPVDGPRDATYGLSLTWTGREVVAWGGSLSSNLPLTEAAAYDPLTDSWRALPRSPRAVFQPEPVWTGTRLLAWGFTNAGVVGQRSDLGFAFDPSSGAWSELPTAPLDTSRQATAAAPESVWTGAALVAWTGGLDTDRVSALLYDPSTRSWSPLPPAPVGAQESYASGLVWTGDRLLAFTYGGPLELSSIP